MSDLMDILEDFYVSVCWSPKGKQLVIGTGNGTLMQFDHELKKKRDWDRPSVLPQEQQFEGEGWTTVDFFFQTQSLLYCCMILSEVL